MFSDRPAAYAEILVDGFICPNGTQACRWRFRVLKEVADETYRSFRDVPADFA